MAHRHGLCVSNRPSRPCRHLMVLKFVPELGFFPGFYGMVGTKFATSTLLTGLPTLNSISPKRQGTR